MVFQGLLTKGRPLETRYETKDFNLKPGKPWILAKKLLISLCEMFFTHIFPRFYNQLNNLRKCLHMDLLCRNSSLMVFHGLLTKRRPLAARYETKDFNGKSGRPWILAKRLLISLWEMFFTHTFRAFLSL